MKDPASKHPNDSAVQRAIEIAILKRLDIQNSDWRRTDWISVSKKYQLPVVWQKTKPDAVWETESGELILAECYTRIETLKPGHYGKLAKDCLKLVGIKQAFDDENMRVRCLMIMPDELVEQSKGNGWLMTSIRQTVEIVGVSLHDSERSALSEAVLEQATGHLQTARKPNGSK